MYEYDYDNTSFAQNQDIRTGLLTGIVHPIGEEHWEYDGNFGQVIEYTDPEFHVTSYEVNSTNGNVESMTQDLLVGDELVTTYTYTDGTEASGIKGLVKTIIDPNDNGTHYTYNSQGLVETIVYAENTIDEVTEEYAYDDRDRLHIKTDGGGDHDTEYIYDNLDRLIERIDPDPDDEGELERPVWHYAYDPNGNRTQVIDPKGSTTEYVYDARSRVMQVIEPMPNPETTPSFTYRDDSQGTFDEVTTWTQTGRTGSYQGDVYVNDAYGGVVSFTVAGLNANKKYAVQVRWTPSNNPTEYDANALFEVLGDPEADPLNKLSVNLNFNPPGSLDEGTALVWLSLGAVSPVENTLTIKLSDDDDNGKLVIDAVRLVEVGPVTQTDYDCNGNLVRTIDPLNHVTEYAYDDLNRRVAQIDSDPDGSGTAGSPVTLYTYNAAGWLTSVAGPTENGSYTRNTTFYQHDAMGRPTKEVKVTGSGLTGEYYDGSTLLQQTLDPDIDYEPFTALPDGFTAVWTGGIHVEYAADVTFSLNNTDHCQLYIDDQLVLDHQSLSGITGDEDSAFLAAGWHTLKVTFSDNNDEPESSLALLYGSEGGEVTLGTTQVTTRTYDDDGRVTHIIDPLNRDTEYTYDEIDRITRIADVTVSGSGMVTKHSYDAVNNAVISTQVMGLDDEINPSDTDEDLVTTYTYDHMDRLHTIDNPNHEVTTYNYDDAGNRISLTDFNLNTTEWDYDNLNRVIAEGDDRSYEYDANGNLIKRTDAYGRGIRYEYDRLNRLTAEKWYADADEDMDPDHTISFSYNAASQLAEASEADDSNGTYVTYAYSNFDGLGRATTITQTLAGLAPTVIFNRSYEDYRLVESKATIGFAADFKNTYEYDGLNQLKLITQTAQTSAGHNYVSDKRVDFAYNAASQVASVARYTSTGTTNPVSSSGYSYDNSGRLSQITHNGTAGGSTFDEFHHYEYDDANRIEQYTNDIDDLLANYDYDASGQLTHVDYNSGMIDEDYNYDDNGNREEVDNFAGNDQDYSTVSSNELEYGGIFTYEYDSEGNRLLRVNTQTHDWTWYEWDHRNRLTSVIEQSDNGYGSETWEDDFTYRRVDYKYDAFDQLIKRTVDPDGDLGNTAVQQTFFLYDQGQIVLQFDKSGSGDVEASNLSHRYLWGPAVDQLLADEQVDWVSDSDADGPVYWAMTDNLGSVRDVIDSDGKKRIHRKLDSFGNITSETHYNASEDVVTSGTGFVTEAFAYTGRYFDTVTGLQNNLHRWYDAKVGRWLSEDPIGFNAGDANLYRYVGNMPTMYTDPQGQQTERLPPVDPINNPIAPPYPGATTPPSYPETPYPPHPAMPPSQPCFDPNPIYEQLENSRQPSYFPVGSFPGLFDQGRPQTQPEPGIDWDVDVDPNINPFQNPFKKPFKPKIKFFIGYDSGKRPNEPPKDKWWEDPAKPGSPPGPDWDEIRRIIFH